MAAAELIVEDLGLDELAELGQSLKRESQRIAKARALVEGEILRRMAAEGASMMVTRRVTIKREVQRSYVWDVPKLVREFAPMVAPALWAECIEVIPPKPAEPEYKVGTVKLLGIARKLGTRAEQALAGCYRIEERAPRVEYEERDEEDVPL